MPTAPRLLGPSVGQPALRGIRPPRVKRLSPEEQRAARAQSRAARPPAPKTKRRPSEAAKKAAKEAHERKYLYLDCGHYGAREDTETLMRAFRPDKEHWWCDVEGKWVKASTRSHRRIEYPEKAPF